MAVSIITAIIGCVCGNISMLLLFPQIRKSKNIENESKQSAEWQKLYEEEHENNRLKDEKIDTLYLEISKHRDHNASLSVEMAQLEVENTRLKIFKCDIPACQQRTPPTGY